MQKTDFTDIVCMQTWTYFTDKNLDVSRIHPSRRLGVTAGFRCLKWQLDT